MGILKHQRKAKGDDHMVGSYVPKEVSSFLTLYSIGNNMSKSKLFLQILTEWMATIPQSSIDSCADVIVERGLLAWEENHTKHRNFSSFCDTLKWELQVKGLSNDTALEVITKLKKERYEKGKREEEAKAAFRATQ